MIGGIWRPVGLKWQARYGVTVTFPFHNGGEQMNTNSSQTVKHSTYAKFFLIGSVGMYLLACFLPVLNTEYKDYRGWWLLAFGWSGVFILQFAWLANPLLWGAWILILARRWGLAMILGILAFFVGLNTFTVSGIPPFPPAVSSIPVSGLGIGAYVWFGSIIAIITSAAIYEVARRWTILKHG